MKPLHTPLAALMLGLALLFSTPTTHAQQTPDLSRMDLGSHVTGPEISLRDFRGRVVVIEYWGITCAPCIRAIPHTTELAKEYGHDKLVIVANQSWSASDKKCKEVWEQHAKSNYVAVINGGKLPGFTTTSVPRAVVFDHKGKFLWEGSPGGMGNIIKTAVANVPDKPASASKDGLPPEPIIADLETKYFKREVQQINEQKRTISGSLAKIRRAAERASKEEQKEEAVAILAVVTTWATDQHTKAQAALTDDPATAYAIAEATSKLLGKDELGTAHAEMKKTIEADDALMDTIRSTNMLREVMALAESLGMNDDAQAARKDRSNSKDIRSIHLDLRRIAKAWPETEAAKKATELLETWGYNE